MGSNTVDQAVQTEGWRYAVDPPFTDRVGAGVYERVQAEADKWEPVAAMPRLPPGRTWRDLSRYGRPFESFRMLYDARTGKFFLPSRDAPPARSVHHMHVFQVISSALLLYRTLCLWDAVPVLNGPEWSDRYKCLWGVMLRHKATGGILTLSEHKGGVSGPGVMLPIMTGPLERGVDQVASADAVPGDAAAGDAVPGDAAAGDAVAGDAAEEADGEAAATAVTAAWAEQKLVEDVLAIMNELVAHDCPHTYDGVVAGSVA